MELFSLSLLHTIPTTLDKLGHRRESALSLPKLTTPNAHRGISFTATSMPLIARALEKKENHYAFPTCSLRFGDPHRLPNLAAPPDVTTVVQHMKAALEPERPSLQKLRVFVRDQQGESSQVVAYQARKHLLNGNRTSRSGRLSTLRS
jgi:hypothetical protein